MITADENVGQDLIDQLVELGYEVYSIREHQPGISDRMVIETVKSKKVEEAGAKNGQKHQESLTLIMQ